MVERDVVLAKVAAIDHCLARIADVRGNGGGQLRPIDVEELVLLNIQRATQAAIDLAAHVVATEGYGLPTDLAETFTLIERQAIIDAPLAARLRSMVGFRNIAVHQYDAIDPVIVETIVSHHLDDLRGFAKAIVDHFCVS